MSHPQKSKPEPDSGRRKDRAFTVNTETSLTRTLILGIFSLSDNKGERQCKEV